MLRLHLPLSPDPDGPTRSGLWRLIGACALLALTLPASAQDAMPDGLLGRWSGAATEAGTPRLFDLAFSLDADGALTTEITQPYNGYDRFTIGFDYRAGGPYNGTLTGGLFGDEMRLVVDLAEGHLRGTVVASDSVTMRVHLQRVLDVPRPVVRQERVAFAVGPDTLAGVVYLPGGDGPHPGAVMVAGRGQSAVYWMFNWATLLARSGVAALVWDGRGVGGSTGAAATVTAEDREAETRAAIDALAGRADVGRVGLVSYSAGGWIVPNVAAERDDVAFVVTMVGPVESLADQQGHVTTAFMRASGDAFTDAEYAQAFAYQQATVELAQEGASWSAFEQINAPARAARWAEHALVPDSLNAPDLDYFRRRTGFDAPAWDRVRAPVLALFGEIDTIVPPEHNAPRLRAALAGNADATVVVVPGADHSLARPPAFVGRGAWPDRFYRPWTRSPVVFDALVGWLQDRFVPEPVATEVPGR